MADFLVALGDFDRGRAGSRSGTPASGTTCTGSLGSRRGRPTTGWSPPAWWPRFPDVEVALRDGRLCITSVVELARVLTPENRAEVLPRFFHRSKQEARAVAAEVCRRSRAAAAHGRDLLPVLPGLMLLRRRTPSPVRPLRRRPRPRPRPPPRPCSRLRPDRWSTPHRRPAPAPRHGRRFLEKLEAARDALSHARPGAAPEDVLEAGLDLILAREARRRARSRAPAPPPVAATPPTPATSPPTSAAPSGSATGVAAPGRSTPATSAARPSA